MANEFDPYREALVMEQSTIWPEEFEDLEPDERTRIERLLHASAEQAAELTYQRSHTGFSREISVTAADVQRVKQDA